MRKILLNLEISTKCRAACSMCPRKHVPKNKFGNYILFYTTK